MKEAILVDLNGRYVEPLIVSDEQKGVTPIYGGEAELLDGGLREQTITGYIIAEKVPEGLYRPRWDFASYKRHQEELTEAQMAYAQAYSKWIREDVETRGNAPALALPDAPPFWLEGLTQPEIDAIRNPPQMPTLEQELTKLKTQLAFAMQAAADANDTQQQLLDHLIRKGVL